MTKVLLTNRSTTLQSGTVLVARDGDERVIVDRAAPIWRMGAPSTKGDREGCLKAGMADSISKPIQREKLFEVIERWAYGHKRGVSYG